MKREAYQKLVEWKSKSNRKPLILQGARQVGKTWLTKEFGKNEFEQIAYFNFESNLTIHGAFQNGFNPIKIIEVLGIAIGRKIDLANTLVVFDEIQACPNALTSLKYFQENAPEIAIIAAGSLLGVAIHQGISFPVGKVDFLQLNPLSFSEFLSALGQDLLLKPLMETDDGVMAIFKETYTNLLRQYYYVGGMPEAVADFVKNRDYQNVRIIQNNILLAYENDFSKHAPITQLRRIRLVWQSIVSQLAKENTKFVYNVLKPGARAKEFELAIDWLKDAGLIHKVNRINKPGIPLSAYVDLADFKLYLFDIGLLAAMGNIDPTILLKGNDFFEEFKGAITEQFVLQQIIYKGYQPYYWSTQESMAEVDFVIQKNQDIIPIEVKASENLKSRSLRIYFDKFNPTTCIRTSLSNYKKQDWMQNIPLYALHSWL
ncbi:MAG: DUF4143 domain-containing protein [bacterium]|nr:DUF4143 domain-containing protein [bacterium]